MRNPTSLRQLSFAGHFMGLVALASIAGCTCASERGGECESSSDCAADPDPCFERYCARGPNPGDPGFCEPTPRAGCGDTGVDAPMDVPGADTTGLDVSALDVPMTDVPPDTRTATGVTACPPPPVEVVDRERDTPGSFDSIANLCLRIPGGSCFITTTVIGSIPTDPSECPVEDLALHHATAADGASIMRANAAFRFAAADVPVQIGSGSALLREDGDTTMVIQHNISRELWRVVVEARDGAALWRTVEPFTGVAPEHGEAHACFGEPREYTTAIVTSGREALVRICDERRVEGICTVHGDVEGSPESESCDAYVVELGFLTGPPRGPYARAVSGPAYDFLTTTHGTLSPNSVTGQPEDTDVTMTASNGTHEIEIVARWSGDSVTTAVRPL